MIYERDRKVLSGGVVVDFLMDADADVSLLPGVDRVGLASMALSIATGKLFALTGTGWKEVSGV